MAEEQLAPEEGSERDDAPIIEETDSEAGVASPLSVEDYARARGWRPKEEWSGDGEWRDAKTFLDYGLDSRKDISRELKDLRDTTSRMADAQARIMQENVERARSEEREKWNSVHRKAVEDGDHEAAQRAVENIAKLAIPAAGDPAQSFVAENQWFNTDPIARQVAIAAADAVSHLSPTEQFQRAREEVFKRFPEYAPKSEQKEPAKQIEVAAPATTAMPAKKGKSFHDLPREAQQAAKALQSRGLLPGGVDGYVKQFFNEEGTVA